jgi:cell wall-associated NlpC family hydrolase
MNTVIIPALTARDRFLKAVADQLGKPVLMGGTAPDVFDCSELVAWGVLQAGGPDQRGTHTAQRYHDESRELADGEPILPGDLAFYGTAPDAVTHVTICDEYGGVISADGATRAIKSLSVALANPANRVRRHGTVRYRRDCPYVVVRRNVIVDKLDNVTR